MSNYRKTAEMYLNNIEARHSFGKETEYTRALDNMDYKKYLMFKEKAEQEEKKIGLEVDAQSKKNVEKEIKDLLDIILGGR